MCCVANPYISTWKIRRKNRLQHEGVFRRLAGFFPLFAVILAAPLLEDVFLHFLERPEQLESGAIGYGMRLGWFCCAAMSLRTYTALVRSDERAILDPHPGDPSQLLRYLTLRCGVESVVLLASAVAMLWPIAGAGHEVLFFHAAAVVAMGWVLGLFLGFPVHLAAVWAAESKSLAAVMEALRGSNPRLQAALIYAPGLVLALGGVGVWSSAEGLLAYQQGHTLWWLWLCVPILGALGFWLVASPLARSYHYRTTMLLAEIDSYYARLEDPEEAKLVYLQWTLRPFPATWKPYLLLELRHGWRGLRTWITGAWGLGLFAALSATSQDGSVFERSVALAGAGLVLIAGVAIRLSAANPQWLEDTLPFKNSQRIWARFWVVFLWLQGVVLLVPLAVAWRHSGSEALIILGGLESLALLLSAWASWVSPWRSRGWAAYLPVALLIWAGSLGVLA